MPGEAEEPEDHTILCDICHEEIKVGDKFLEIYTNEGVKTHSGGYIKEERQYLSRELGYIHLKHALYLVVPV